MLRIGQCTACSSFCAVLSAATCCIATSSTARAKDVVRSIGADSLVELALGVSSDQVGIVQVEQIGIDAVFDVLMTSRSVLCSPLRYRISGWKVTPLLLDGDA